MTPSHLPAARICSRSSRARAEAAALSAHSFLSFSPSARCALVCALSSISLTRMRAACPVSSPNASGLPSSCATSLRKLLISAPAATLCPAGSVSGVPGDSSSWSAAPRSLACVWREPHALSTGLSMLCARPAHPCPTATAASRSAAAAGSSPPASAAMRTNAECVSAPVTVRSSPASSALATPGASKTHGSSPGASLAALARYGASHAPTPLAASAAPTRAETNSGEVSTCLPPMPAGLAIAPSSPRSSEPSAGSLHAGGGGTLDAVGKLKPVERSLGSLGAFAALSLFAISALSGASSSALSYAFTAAAAFCGPPIASSASPRLKWAFSHSGRSFAHASASARALGSFASFTNAALRLLYTAAAASSSAPALLCSFSALV
mmetsp:Transcript_1627/g.5628  ORF Transcript_1627/g.5628 Transcript_1627/m.5628 type:complete len:382 (+) Transcript_1627:311-1456(+)